MIKVIMTILAGAMLWLGAVGHAHAAIPMFVEKANQLSVEEFRVFFQKADLIDLEGNVRIDDMGRKLHPVFKDKLHEAAAKDEQSLAKEFVSMYGLTVPLEKLYEQAKVGKIVLPDAVLTAPGTAEPAVAAASAPIAPATPVAVSEAPAPVAKPLPTAPAAGDDNAIKEQMFAELRKQRAEIEADVKGSRKAAFDAINHAVAEMGKTHKVTKQEMERFVTEAVKSFEKDPADQKAIKDAVIKVASVDAKIKALDEVDAAHSASIARLGGRQLWQNIAIGLVGFLVIVGFAVIWWRFPTKGAMMAAIGSVNKNVDVVKGELAGRIEVLEGVVYKNPEWELTAEQRKELFGTVFGLVRGGTADVELDLGSRGIITLTFIDEGDDLVRVEHIDGRPFSKKKVCTKVTEFYHGNKLPLPATVSMKLAA